MAWLPPDEVLPRAIRLIAESMLAAGQGKVALVRDLRGQVRVVLERADSVSDADALETALAYALGSWFVRPVVRPASRAHESIAKGVFAQAAAWPTDWPATWDRGGDRVELPARLVGLTAVLGKESWLAPADGRRPPSPRVVSFFSFKGGVGRTTALACVAHRLCEVHGLRIVAVDLDIEAPGLAELFGVQREVGVVDHVVSHLATGEVGDVEPAETDAHPSLRVVPAGRIASGYLEKVARLDYLSRRDPSGASPAEAALVALLDEIAVTAQPDMILLDSRAGLHDLGGLALHRLAHTDVLVARASAQARLGMEIVLDAIQRLRPSSDELDVCLVQTMVPLPLESAVARQATADWRRCMYDACSRTLYRALQDQPQESEEAAHHPLVIGYREELSRIDRFSQISPAVLAEYDLLASRLAPAAEPEPGGDP